MSEEYIIEKKSETEDFCDNVCEKSVIAQVSITRILRQIVLLKKYALENNDEASYLCADYIERELHQLRYDNAVLDKEW